MAIDAQSGVQQTPLERALGRKSGVDDTSSLFKSARPGEEIIRAVLLFCGIVSIFTTIGIVVVLVRESLSFLSAEAWLPERVPVIVEDPATFTLDADISADATRIETGGLEGAARRAFFDGRFLVIDNEIMSIQEQTDDGVLLVERGVARTEAADHTSGATVTAMQDAQIRIENALSNDPEDNQIQLPEGTGAIFDVNERIRIGQSSETMLITAIDGDTLTVERGYEDFAATSHPADEQIQTADRVRLPEFFTNTRWSPTLGEFGIAPLVTATLTITVIALLVATPLGLGAAIYLSEYANPRTRGTLKPILEILAGVPTVVYGYFAIQFMTPLLQAITPDGVVGVYNMASAGIVMGIMIVPTIASMSEDALSAVPDELRRASFGLGSTRYETTLKIVIPAALSGILAAVILAIARAVGETMIVAIAAGGRPNFTINPFAEAETMTGHIVRISKGDLSYDSVEYNSIFAIGIALFVMTLSLNLFSNWVARRFRESY